LIGLLVTVLLLCITALFEQLPLGHRTERLAYEFLQNQLSSFDPQNRPVVVVDISQISGGKGVPTPRPQLQALVLAIVDQKPQAIALDIDFSPNENWWITPEDPDFFDFCLEMKRDRKVPVFLGVWRAKLENSDTWLGLEKYKELAVILSGREGEPGRVPLWIHANGVSDRLPGLSSALAQVKTPLSGLAPPSWMAWAIEKTADHRPGTVRKFQDFELADTLVNHSKLEALQNEALVTVSPQSVGEAGWAHRFENKLVILGDATSFGDDGYTVPGRDKPVAGVFMHACAVYTFIKEPLYELKPGMRWILDGMLSVIIILLVAWIRYRNPTKDEYSWHKLQSRFIDGAILVIICGGIVLVRVTGIMWLDFILAGFALLLHPTAEGLFTRLRKRRRGSRRSSKLVTTEAEPIVGAQEV